MTDMKNNKISSIEEQFASIEDIISKMEAGEVTLDETFDLYKKGLEQIKSANAMLDDMEKAILVMNEDGGLEEF